MITETKIPLSHAAAVIASFLDFDVNRPKWMASIKSKFSANEINLNLPLDGELIGIWNDISLDFYEGF